MAKKKTTKVEEATPASVMESMGVAALAPKPYSFDILDTPTDMMDNVKACMVSAANRKKNRPTDFKTLAEIRKQMMPIRNFYFQYTLGSYGMPQQAIIDIIGQPHVGKSSLILWLFGGFMTTMGVPCYLQHTETKPMDPDHSLRFLHTDPQVAVKILDRIISEPVYSLEHSLESMIRWVDTMRGRESTKERRVNVPITTPLVVAVDTWSKLLNPKEAAGKYDYGTNLEAAGMKAKTGIGEGSNFGHAKWAQEFCRLMPSWLEANNVILILARHQNAKIDMDSFNPVKLPVDFNDTSIGGGAFAQNAALQLILVKRAQAKDGANNVIGDIIGCRVNKQSYGPRGRRMEWVLQNDGFHDSDNHIAPGLVFDDAMANWFVTSRLLGAKADNKSFTCDALNVTGVSASAFCRAFEANTACVYNLGKALKIKGYIDVVDEIRKEINVQRTPESPGVENPPQPPAGDGPEVASE